MPALPILFTYEITKLHYRTLLIGIASKTKNPVRHVQICLWFCRFHSFIVNCFLSGIIYRITHTPDPPQFAGAFKNVARWQTDMSEYGIGFPKLDCSRPTDISQRFMRLSPKMGGFYLISRRATIRIIRGTARNHPLVKRKWNAVSFLFPNDIYLPEPRIYRTLWTCEIRFKILTKNRRCSSRFAASGCFGAQIVSASTKTRQTLRLVSFEPHSLRTGFMMAKVVLGFGLLCSLHAVVFC